MEDICLAEISDFFSLGEVVNTPDGNYIYIDRGADVLGVAHLDTVCPPTHFTYSRKKDRVYCPTLDDRLGATILLDVLDKLIPGEFDILLTEGEEVGRSTAKYFTPPFEKEYNWIFSFDRSGTDAVYYQFQNQKWMDALEVGMNCPLDVGLFSDICFMDHLGVSGVNVGCAYYAYHSKNAWCDLEESEMMVRKFVSFFRENQGERFPHEVEKDLWGRWDDDWDRDWDRVAQFPKEEFCDYCGNDCDSVDLIEIPGLGLEPWLLCDRCIDDVLKENLKDERREGGREIECQVR